MLLIPAIDLKEGRYVRLKQGLMEQATVFSDSPAKTALYQFKQGVHHLYLVGLNSAFVSIPKNFPTIKSILVEVANDIPVQSGDGIRDLAIIEKYLDLGLADVITGTVVVKSPDFVREACKEFPGQIIVGSDTKGGMVVINGWATVTERRVAGLVKRFEEDGVDVITCINVGHDDMTSGINIKATVRLAQAAVAPVIALGGLTNLGDIHALCAVEEHGAVDAITSRTTCENSIDFAEMQKLADTLSTA